MAKRTIVMGFRCNAEENAIIREGHELTGERDSFSAYLRRIALGEFRHPFYDEDRLTQFRGGDVNDSGPIIGGYETRIHYTAYVLAAEMMRVKMDPAYHEIIARNKPMYNTLVDQIRGYTFDEKSQQKSPLPINLRWPRSDPEDSPSRNNVRDE